MRRCTPHCPYTDTPTFVSLWLLLGGCNIFCVCCGLFSLFAFLFSVYNHIQFALLISLFPSFQHPSTPSPSLLSAIPLSYVYVAPLSFFHPLCFVDFAGGATKGCRCPRHRLLFFLLHFPFLRLVLKLRQCLVDRLDKGVGVGLRESQGRLDLQHVFPSPVHLGTGE